MKSEIELSNYLNRLMMIGYINRKSSGIKNKQIITLCGFMFSKMKLIIGVKLE